MTAAVSSFQAHLVSTVIAEHATFEEYAETESPLKERIGEYWTFVERPGWDGATDKAWSAAFISYMVDLAGGDGFPSSGQHSVYFYRTINDKLANRDTPFWGYRAGELEIVPGDIVGMNRQIEPPIDYDFAAHEWNYSSHADIVVGIENGVLLTIGGNVDDQVGTKRFALNEQNIYVNTAAETQQVFLVIRSSLP
jgi:hypothetical protein